MRQRRFAMVELLESNFFDFENQNLTLTAGDPVSVAGKKSTGTIYRVRKHVYDVEFEDPTAFTTNNYANFADQCDAK